MKTGTRLFILLLAAVLIVLPLSACGDRGDDDNSRDTYGPTDTSTVDDTEDLTYHIPDSKYDDEEITILCPTDDAEWTCRDFFAEDDSEDPVLSAVYQRQNVIEETFGVKIKTIEGASRATINGLVQTADRSGDLTYDIVFQTMPRVYTMAQNKLLLNLNAVPHLELESSAWDQSYLAQTSISGNNYFATGEITTMDNDATWVMMFNKKVAAALDRDDIYDLVKDDKWTMDKLLEYTANCYQDTDNSGTITHLDNFGIATTIDFIQGLFFGGNGHIIVKDESDIPMIDYLNDKNVKLIDKIIQIYYKSNSITFDCHDYISINPSAHLIAQAMFEEDRAFFYSEVMQCVTRLRSMDTDFGIIPVPKYDLNQTNYTTHSVADVTLVCCFPRMLEKDSNRLEMVGAVAQALAVEGLKILTPAYYDKSLVGKGTRDEESADMLPIIFANRIADMGYTTEGASLSSFYTSMRSDVRAGKNQISSSYERNRRAVQRDLENFIEKYENIE